VGEVLQYLGWLVGLPLELLIIAALLRGPYRRFPLLLLYSLALFLTTVIEISVNEAYFAGVRFGISRATYYWVDEGIREGLLFALVLSLAYLATEKLQSRNVVRTALIAGGVLFAVASFVIHHHNQLAAGGGHWRWMTLWVRDITFAAAIIDLGAWVLLIASRHKDLQPLLLTGGLGVQFAGAAIGESLRFLFRQFPLFGDIVEATTSLAGMWIWWQALRSAPVPKAARVTISPRRDRTGATRL
jgi:hypothetical protein